MTAGRRRRLDVDLVRRGHFDTRQRAQEAIAEGRVLVGGAVAERPSRLVASGEPLEVVGRRRFVGRGGEKLEAALASFQLDPAGAVALDAGASTGGFTDCLLQRGAALVVAVDVGHGQLDPKLRADGRVVVMERTHVRDVDLDALGRVLPPDRVPVDLVTADLSFISLTGAVRVLAGAIVRPRGDLVLLVKPQFEVGRKAASRAKGVIRDPELWLGALRSVGSSLEGAGAVIMGAVRSTPTGAAGNTEFFVHAVAHGREDPPNDAARPATSHLGAALVDLSPAAARLFADAVAQADR